MELQNRVQTNWNPFVLKCKDQEFVKQCFKNTFLYFVLIHPDKNYFVVSEFRKTSFIFTASSYFAF